MITMRQVCHGNVRRQKLRKVKAKKMEGRPQLKGICMKVTTMKPKKPNSAIRKIARVLLTGTKKTVTVYIPGQGHNLQQYSVVLIRGGRVPDLLGVHYHALRGKLDFSTRENFERRTRRSKYSLKK
jgi:small subunit ribosomal protein S12